MQKKNKAPDISEVFRFPVEEMSWRTMKDILDDIEKAATNCIHDGIHGWSGKSLVDSKKAALDYLLLSYNYLDRWCEGRIERMEAEPF